MNKIKELLNNLPDLIEETRTAILCGSDGPQDPLLFEDLMTRVKKSRRSLPPVYRNAVCDGFIQTLDEMGPEGFAILQRRDPERRSEAAMLFDVAQAILQNGEQYAGLATDAFQEVVSDLYDGFLSAEDRMDVKPPDWSVLAPLVKWGSPEYGPYVFTAPGTSAVGIECSVVNLPLAHIHGGLLAWTALPHETAGHAILHADDGLHEELAAQVYKAVEQEFDSSNPALATRLANYWAWKIDETASDILGILNAGPTIAVGLIGYFRALDRVYGGEGKLSLTSPWGADHPADIMRAYLGAETVRQCSFSTAKEWAEAIVSEADKDLGENAKIELDVDGGDGIEFAVTRAQARESAAIVAETIVRRPIEALENASLLNIQDWMDEDEQITEYLGQFLVQEGELFPQLAESHYAAHVVAAAMLSSLKGNPVETVFSRMQQILKRMHDANPSWGAVVCETQRRFPATRFSSRFRFRHEPLRPFPRAWREAWPPSPLSALR